jgi:GT2 family glycosyltransferase
MANKKSGVIYTCITGGYDDLKNHTYIDQDWDYICFTDDLSIGNANNSSWQIRPLFFDKLDNVRNQRWHKLHPHILFPEYEKSIWIDGNLDVLNDGLFNDVQMTIEEKNLISIAPHPSRKCLYDEFEACVSMGKDDAYMMKEQINLIKKSNFPKKFGLFETSIMFRAHNNEKIIKVMDDWWWWIENYSRRDQLSFTYSLWKNNLLAKPLTDVSYRKGDKISFTYDETHVTKEELLSQKGYLEKEINVLRDAIEEKNRTILQMESSIFWRLRGNFISIESIITGGRIFEIAKKIGKTFRNKGLKGVVISVYKYGLLRPKHMRESFIPDDEYRLWIDKNEIGDIIDQSIFLIKPKISIVIAIRNAGAEWLDECIQSVMDQSYENWELCLYDDASTRKETIGCLKKWGKVDSRIKILYGNKKMSIAESLNKAIGMTDGEFVMFLDGNDKLSPYALHENISIINKHPEADFIYSDEDCIDDAGKRSNPFFKPDWSPDLFHSLNYVSRLSALRKTIGDEVGWFQSGYEGAQDFDLFLRFFKKTKYIQHISKVLYHYRISEKKISRSIGFKKKYYGAEKKALQSYIKENRIIGHIGKGIGKNDYRLKYDIPKQELVSIIIPFKDKMEVLKKCIDSIFEKTTYNNYEILLIKNNCSEKETDKYLESIWNDKRIKILERNVPFNYSAINNWAIPYADGKFILFLNNDTEVISSEWLDEMMSYAARKDVGAVGAQLLYPDGRIQHAGVILGLTGLAGHIFCRQRLEETYFDLANYPRNYLAVTAACLLIKKNKFLEVGGFDERFTVCGNDVDLCLKLYEKGYLNVAVPYAKLYHHESLTRDIQPPGCDIEISKKRYAPFIGKDPYYNRNLSLKDEHVKININ